MQMQDDEVCCVWYEPEALIIASLCMVQYTWKRASADGTCHGRTLPRRYRMVIVQTQRIDIINMDT